MKIAIKNGQVIDPFSGLNGITDIMIDRGKIVQIGHSLDFTADKIIDATNLTVTPGLIDVCCRPQMLHPHGTTITQEAFTALKRGITSLCIPPDGDPILDSAANVLRLIQQGSHSLPRLYPIGALTTSLKGKLIADLTALAHSGCIAFTNAQKPIKDLGILRHAYDYAASFDLLLVIQPQDPWLTQGGVAHEGINATHLGLPGIPEIAETVAIAQHLLLIEQTGVRAHFTCLSSKQGVEQIRKAKAKGLPITADTAMHSLHLIDTDIDVFDANCHLYPPLRDENDKLGLIAGVMDGTIDTICSDHRPLDSIAKLAPFGDTTPGMSALDTFLGLGLLLVEEKKLTLNKLIEALTRNSAQIFNLPTGKLSKGAPADLCIFDTHRHWVVSESLLYSKGKNTPFKNYKLPGKITHTLLGGKILYDENE